MVRVEDGFRERLDREVISALPGADLSGDTTSQARYAKWRKSQSRSEVVEYLLPRLTRRVVREWPAYMDRQPGHAGMTREELAAEVQQLAPWLVPFRLRDGVTTIDLEKVAGSQNVERYLFRRDLITGTLAELLGDDLATSTVLDIGCNAGFFSLDIATRGAQHVDGVDLREGNIAKARFVAEHYGVDNVTFHVSDADDLAAGRQWDVVLNLGLLYHVINPLQLLRQTYELCSRFAIVDSICHTEPVAAFMLFGNKNVEYAAEGRDEWEFHPTYRGAIEALYYAGFSEVIEIVGQAEPPHPFYADGNRRCFLAVK